MVVTAAAAVPASTDAEPTLRVGFLAQENLAVPPPVPGASVSRVVYELAQELPAHDVDVTICSLPNQSVPEGLHDGVRYVRVEEGLDHSRHARYRQLVRVLRRLDLPHSDLQGFARYGQDYAARGLARLAELEPDIVHLQNVSQFVPVARRLMPNTRIVLHMHCDWLRQLPARTVRARLEEADLVLGVSDYISDRIRRGFPALAARVRTLHNGVRTDLFSSGYGGRETLRRRMNLPAGPLALYVGSIAPEKGTDVLVRAFAEVHRRLPDAVLVIVGSPNRYFQVRSARGRGARAQVRRRQNGYGDEVARLAALLGQAVVFAGRRPHEELPEWYALADVFAMPSTGAEPFPLPVLEAFACGLPVVATTQGGLPEAVLDGVNGRLVPPHDPVALAVALVELCSDRGLAAQLGQQGRKIVMERFTWANQARLLAGYYRDLRAGRCGPAGVS
jgi:glycosyltransferase involved in cell wall biosynthesis